MKRSWIMMLVSISLALALGAGQLASAQTEEPSPATYVLTPAKIQTAIERGLKSNPLDIGLAFDIREFNNAKAFARSALKRFGTMGLDNSHGRENFGLVVFTPLAWIERAAALAASQLRPFTSADVTDDMRRPVVRLLVKPRATHVVLRDSKKEVIIQPLPDVNRQWSGGIINFGDKAVAVSASYFEFPLDDIARLQSRDEDSQFFIQVQIVPGRDESFEVKKKHLDRFPL